MHTQIYEEALIIKDIGSWVHPVDPTISKNSDFPISVGLQEKKNI